MHLYSKLTDEQIKQSNKNNAKARRWFKRNGFMPDSSKTYDLHHKDPSLRVDDVERYIQWNIDDLVCLEHSEHTKLHQVLANIDDEKRSLIAKKMWKDPESYVNSEECRNLIANIVHNNHIKENTPYNSSWRNKISKSCKKYWTDDKKEKQRQAVKSKWEDPDSVYHTDAFRKARAKGHMKKIIIEENGIKISFSSEYECGLALGYSTKEKATNMVGWMISKKGYVTSRKSIYKGWKIYREDKND